MSSSANDYIPQSVEEAGALLGAAIPTCGASGATCLPPKGMHSSFATVSPVPSAELFTRLHSLRALLKSAPVDEPLVAAPSLLAVLIKLLGVSNNMASSAPPKDCRAATPPMLSTPLRRLWVDCVVLCHGLGEGLSGTARIDVFTFVRNMVAMASTNPKSAKAAGGTRIAALQVIGGLFSNEKLTTKLAPWALDVLQLCHRSLRSSGNGEPTFRITAVQTACCVATACRQASLKARPLSGSQCLIISGAMEDRAVVETTRLLRQAAADKFPELRIAAANLAAIMAPMLLYSDTMAKTSGDGSNTSSTTSSLEEVLVLAMRNLDDEIAGVALAWADAVARCLCTCIQYGKQVRSNTNHSSRRSADDGDGAEDAPTGDQGRIGTRKGLTFVQQCSTLSNAISYLVDHFIKAGGELAASRQGGSFSMGGRAVRIGFSMTMVKLLGIQSKLGNIGQSRDFSMEDAITSILRMVGPDLEKQLKISDSQVNTDLDATSASVHSPEKSSSSLFGGGRNKSHADAGLARISASRVLREGLSELASESMQSTILHELISRCKLSEAREESDDGAAESTAVLTSNQLQVALIEISNLLTALGEAAAASLVDLIPVLQACLGHRVHGVRHEAAIVCAAVACPFPTKARNLFQSSLDAIQVHHAEIVKMATIYDEPAGENDSGSPGRRPSTRRSKRRQEAEPDHPSLSHQFAIHGHSLMLSILLRELPHLPGGLPGTLLGSSLSVAEILIYCQYTDVMTKSIPGAACTCVRAGYSIVCGALTVGPIPITQYTSLIFGLWRKVGNSSGAAVKNFNNDQDLICLDAALSSVVAFLTHCSELLLLDPDALSSSTLMLEQLLPLFLPDGRLGATPVNHVAASRHKSAKASLMEAFAWLPPGSFPMIADKVFTFAAGHIRTGIEAEVTASLLPSLVSNEDKVLDAKSLPRAERCGQVGGAKDIEGNLMTLWSEVAHHGERESVLQLQHGKMKRNIYDEDRELRGSRILGLCAYDGDETPVPTPLHSVGTWHEPISPSSCSKVRLMDAAIQSFSATFGLKDGKEQHNAMLMLESLVPPLLVQLARAIGVDATLAEPDRRNKTKDDHAAIANIVSVLLACLQALPLHEATHDIPIGLGPPWMNKAKDLLLTLLPSTSGVVRRAAAEGLALLATLGVTEDAHTLQSTVLHSLDEVMQGNQPDGKVRIPVAPVSAARAGSLLTLACIQRTTHSITEKHRAMARRRSTNSATVAEVQSDTLPTVQMMTRIIPSVTCHGVLRDREAFVVRTYALHSFGLIIAYSSRLDEENHSRESLHLLKKAVEVVEDNFLAAWTSVSSQYDGGQEADKLAAEASFVAVLLRLMTFLVPALPLLRSFERGISERFSSMAQMILEAFRVHPVVFTEAMAFFEQVSIHKTILPPPASFLRPSEDYLTSCLPFLLQALTPEHPTPLADVSWLRCQGILSSVRGARVAALSAKLLAVNGILVPGKYKGDLPATLFSLLEVTCGRRVFANEDIYRALANSRRADVSVRDHVALEIEVTRVIDAVLLTERNSDASMLHWILFTRCLLTGNVEKADDIETGEHTRGRAIAVAKARASKSAVRVFAFVVPIRWQTRCQAARSATLALQTLSRHSSSNQKAPHFDSSAANCVFAQRVKELRSPESKPTEVPSFVVFHAGDILSSACSSAVATVDQSELWHVQEGGIRLLTEIVSCIGDAGDLDEPGQLLLEEYLSQIISCVKHGLSAFLEDDEDDAEKLFLLGCEALQSTVENKLITDPMVMRRFVKPVLLSKSEMSFFGYEETPDRNWLPSEEDTSFKNFRLSLLPLLGKLWTLGKLRGFAEDKFLPEPVAEALIDEISACKDEVAAYSAAVAIDGSRLLRGSGLSLASAAHNESRGRSENGDVAFDAGFLFDDMHEMDDLVKAALVKAWPECACNAMFTLIDLLRTDDIDEDRRMAYSAWLDALVPVLFAALRDSFEVFPGSTSDHQIQSNFAQSVSAEELIATCLRGLCALLNGATIIKDLVDSSASELAFVVSSVANKIVFPACGIDTGSTSQTSPGTEEIVEANVPKPELVLEACLFTEALAKSEALSDKVESSFLMAVLTTLDALQRNDITFERPSVADIVTSCMKAMRQLILRQKANEMLVNAMLQISVDILTCSESIPNTAIQVAELLMTECLNSDAISELDRCNLAREMASGGKWEAWTIVCSHTSGDLALSCSLSVLKAALADLQSFQGHLSALSAVRRVISQVTVPSNVIDIVVGGVGAQILGLLKAYGTLSIPSKGALNHRLTAFADCMKVIMTAYQNLVANSTEDSQMAAFLSVVFEVWTSVIQFNGLPNQPSPNAGADPSLGRLAAQAIVHIARSSPVSFKTGVAGLSEHGRALLEFSVRAEMGGYATAPTESPAKKKLSLKGFTK